MIFLRHDADLLLPLSLAAFGIMLLRAASLFFGRRPLIDSLGEKTVARAQRDMFGSLIRRDLADLNAVHSGQFVSNFLYDATLMRDALDPGRRRHLPGIGALVVYLAYVLISDWQLGLLALLALPGVAWAMERLGGSMRRAATRGMQETGDLSVVLSEAMDGRRIIKAYGLEDHSIARVEAPAGGAAEDLAEGGAAARRRRAHDRIFAGLVIARWCCSSPAGRICTASSRSTPSSAFIAALLLAQQPVRNLSQLWPTASAGIAAASRMFDADRRQPAHRRPRPAPSR